MAFHIIDQVRVIPATGAMECPLYIAVVFPSHGNLLVAVVHGTPKHHACIGQHSFLIVVGKVFEYYIGVGVYPFDVSEIIHNDVDAALVIGIPCPNIATGPVLRQTLGKVDAKTIHLKLSEPVLENIFEKLSCMRAFVVEVVSHTVGVWRLLIEPGVVDSRCAIATIIRIKIHLYKRIQPKSMIDNDVENHGHAFGVCSIDELLIRLTSAIILVGGEEKVGRIAPAVVAIKLHDGHQLNGIHSDAFQIVELIHSIHNGTGVVEVADKQLIN